jgi:hypothetical protein
VWRLDLLPDQGGDELGDGADLDVLLDVQLTGVYGSGVPGLIGGSIVSEFRNAPAVSDNGASGEGGPNGSVNENKVANGIPDDIQANLAMIDELGGTRTYNHYPNGWAMAFNTPFKMWKRYEFNGGTADPCIISWPSHPGEQVVQVQAGSKTSTSTRPSRRSMLTRSSSWLMSTRSGTAFRSTRSSSAFTSSAETTSSTARSAAAWANASTRRPSRPPAERPRANGSTREVSPPDAGLDHETRQDPSGPLSGPLRRDLAPTRKR